VTEFVNELRQAIGLGAQTIGAGTTGLQSVSTIHILTNPPQAKVFIDNVAVGESQPDGYLLLEGVQSGNHRLKISKDGFHDWENQMFCDGRPQQIVAQLQHLSGQSLAGLQSIANENFVNTQATNSGLQQSTSGQSVFNQTAGAQTVIHPNSQPNWQASGTQSFGQPMPAKKSFSPALLGIIGISALLLLTLIGVGGGYMLGMFGGGKTVAGTPTPTATATPAAQVAVKNELITITGGSFMMGRNEGPPQEQPAHQTEVKDFSMDKTEVTNAEYFEFVKQTGYKAPSYWTGGKPIAGEEMQPVVRVSMEDIKAFAEWRSKRDGFKYRLPTEEEWEYAARNGDSANLYPWGNSWEDGRAAVEQTTLRDVSAFPEGKNKWGVEGLIGNAWEWTSSELKPYPNSNFVIKKAKSQEFIIRGGGFRSESKGEKAIFATSRLWVEAAREDGFLGFRLVKEK
jgi:formylglycine-generating enzyme required for sulfatase activity